MPESNINVGSCVNCVRPIYGEDFIEPKSGFTICGYCVRYHGNVLDGVELLAKAFAWMAARRDDAAAFYGN
jgi:hypothetical protein